MGAWVIYYIDILVAHISRKHQKTGQGEMTSLVLGTLSPVVLFLGALTSNSDCHVLASE